MSPLAIWNHVPTTLDLNGPSLSFTTQPTGVTTTIGLNVSFTGIATVTFPAGTAIEGNISYQWYNSTDGSVVTDGTRTNSAGGITTFSGAETTTLSIQNAQNAEDHNDQYYLNADFKPVGYWRPGNESPNPNAINDTLDSDTVTLKVPSTLSIVLQPLANLDASTALFATFNTNATLTDPSLNSLIEYQWKLNGSALSDDDNTVGANTKTLKIKRDAATYDIECQVSHPDALPSPITTNKVAYIPSIKEATIYSQHVYSHATAPRVSTKEANLNLGAFNVSPRSSIPGLAAASTLNFLYSTDKDIDLLLEIAAAGGSSYNNNRAGKGGWGVFKLSMKKNVEYLIKLGPNDGSFAPWGGKILGSPTRGAIGGGGSFFYRQNRSIVVLGAGGGAGENAIGGDGGGANQDGLDGGGRYGGNGGDGPPVGRGGGGSSQRAQKGEATAACISSFTYDAFRNEGLSDCEAYSPTTLVEFKSSRNCPGHSCPVPNTALLYRGFRQGGASRQNGGWGLNGAGGGGGGGADGGDGAISNGDGGGGGSGYADAGEVDVLATRTGVNSGNGYMRISLYDANAPLPTPPEVTPATYDSILWNDSRDEGYKYGDDSSVGGSNQSVDGTILYGPGASSIVSAPTDYAPLFTGYRAGVGGSGIFFKPEDSDAYNISYVLFHLFIRDLGPSGGTDLSYLTSNRGNRDSSLGTVRKWYSGDQTVVDGDPDLYTTDKNEAFVPFRIDFELAFSCSNGGDYRVMYLEKSYTWDTFGETQDVEFNSAELADQNNITPTGSRAIFPDFWEYNYENPRIVYIRSKIVNLDTQEENLINMYATAISTDTGTGNTLEYGKYLIGGGVPTGTDPTITPTPTTSTVTFTITVSTADSNTVRYRRINDKVGPYEITFGPSAGTPTYDIESGAIYELIDVTASGGRGLDVRIIGATNTEVQCDDRSGDADWDDLIFSCDIGIFSENGNTWTANY